MATEGHDRDDTPSVASTVEDGQPATHEDSSNGADRAAAVDSTLAGSTCDITGLQITIDTIPDVAYVAAFLNAGVPDAGSTPFWDPDETSVAVGTTFAPSCESSAPWSGAGQVEEVPGFEILGELGHGGMGVVYKALQLKLKRLVALKKIRGGSHGSYAEYVARFEIEAEAVARLRHPNIVQIYEIGTAGRVPYVVLELLEGGTLKERLAGTPQPVRDVAELLSPLARAVHAAHVAGILHRDLKPSNVLFDRDGTPKIADFGLAKRLEVEQGETLTGQVIGTPSYMAPEQAKGWDRDIGPTADIYSLGAILYEMLTGRPPLKGTTQEETLRLVLEEEPVAPSRLRPKLPFDLETICLKCIARDPRKRYASALALAEDLDRYLIGEPILARRTPFWERAVKRARKRPVVTVLVAVGIVAAGIALGMAMRQQSLASIEQKKENDRLTGLLQEADQQLSEAEWALAKDRWDDVRVIVSRLLSRIEAESEPRIALVRDKAEHLHAEARQGLEKQTATDQARGRFQRFLELRDEALFADTARFADGLGNSVEATCQAAREALGVFGQAGPDDEWTLAPLSPLLSSQDRDEVTGGFYQLLLILADAISQSPQGTPAQRADQALRILARAEAVRSPVTRSHHLRRADFVAMKGDQEGAKKARDNAARLAPADAFDYFQMGRESIRQSDWPAAITQLSAATQRQPDHFWAECLLAICYLQTHQPTAARAGFNSCLLRKPDRAWIFMLRGLANAGIAQQELGRSGPDQARIAKAAFASAEADYRKALELLGDKTQNAALHYAMLLNRGMMRLVRDDSPAAASDFQAAIGLNDHRFEAFASLGQVYQRQGRTDDALKQFARAIELRPNWAPLYRGRASVYLGLKDLSPELQQMTLSALEDAIRQVSVKRRDAASRDLADAIRLETPGNHLIAADWTKQAALWREAERNDEALDACDKAIAIVRRYAPAHELRIKVLLDLSQYEDLIESCDIVLAWSKPSAKLYELRGIAKNAIEDYSGAIGDFTLSLDLAVEADRPRLLRLRGWSSLANDAHRSAIQDFDEAISLAPTVGEGYLGRGTARALFGRHRDAESDARNAQQFGDASPRFTFRVARIYCLAATAVRAEAYRKRQNVERAFVHYQDSAFDLVLLALTRTPIEQRSAFFRETILSDPAVEPIRRRLAAVAKRLIDNPADP
jgi:tetratricopeptide (TPR) repeat protein